MQKAVMVVVSIAVHRRSRGLMRKTRELRYVVLASTIACDLKSAQQKYPAAHAQPSLLTAPITKVGTVSFKNVSITRLSWRVTKCSDNR